MGLQDLLEYQKTDAQLRKIEQEIGTSEERKKIHAGEKIRRRRNGKDRLAG